MFTAVIVGSLVALAAAQSSVLTFTHVPNPVTDGQAQAITYSTNDTSTPVTIILRRGVSTNLQTVQTLTASATTGQYIWTPSTTLADGDDYALEITQGSQVNYFGPFVVQGASASATTSSSNSSSMSGTATVAPIASSSIILSANGTASTTVAVIPGTVGTLSGSSNGTATAGNTTVNMASLTGSSTLSTTTAGSPASKSASSTSSATTSGAAGAGSQSGSTASAASPSSTTSKNGANRVGCAAAVVLGAVAAAFYLQ